MIDNELDELSIVMPKDIYEDLEKVIARKGTTVNALIQELVENYLNQIESTKIR
jgi:predicted DNA-binding protein